MFPGGDNGATTDSSEIDLKLGLFAAREQVVLFSKVSRRWCDDRLVVDVDLLAGGDGTFDIIFANEVSDMAICQRGRS